jgi:hypothetical protein
MCRVCMQHAALSVGSALLQLLFVGACLIWASPAGVCMQFACRRVRCQLSRLSSAACSRGRHHPCRWQVLVTPVKIHSGKHHPHASSIRDYPV